MFLESSVDVPVIPSQKTDTKAGALGLPHTLHVTPKVAFHSHYVPPTILKSHAGGKSFPRPFASFSAPHKNKYLPMSPRQLINTSVKKKNTRINPKTFGKSGTWLSAPFGSRGSLLAFYLR